MIKVLAVFADKLTGNRNKESSFMGMAASQARLITLTSRKNHIGYDLTMLSAQKMSLARESDKIATAYSDALNKKRLKWSNDAGATTHDLTYKTLMNPSQLNAYEPYMLTDHAGKVVVDDFYHKYAKMISPNGAPGGNYEINRTKILAEILGVSEAELNASLEHTNRLERLRKELAALEEESHPLVTDAVTTMFMKMGKISETAACDKDYWDSKADSGIFKADKETSWAEIGLSIKAGDTFSTYLEKDGSTTEANEKLLTILREFANAMPLEEYVLPADKIEKAIQDTYALFTEGIYSTSGDHEYYRRAINPTPEQNTICHYHDNGNGIGQSSHDTYAVSLTNLVNAFLINLVGQPEEKAKLGKSANYRFDPDKTHLTTRESQDEYDAWQKAIADKKAEIAACEEEFADPLDAEVRKKIAFYDAIFNGIAKFGWSYNENINDEDYLNEVLQMNLYNVTQGERSTTGWEYDESTPTTCPNIFTVSDKDIINKAIADYEANKVKINTKEKAIDTRMQKLETEQAAISEMLEAYRNIIKDNTDRTFNTFG